METGHAATEIARARMANARSVTETGPDVPARVTETALMQAVLRKGGVPMAARSRAAKGIVHSGPKAPAHAKAGRTRRADPLLRHAAKARRGRRRPTDRRRAAGSRAILRVLPAGLVRRWAPHSSSAAMPSAPAAVLNLHSAVRSMRGSSAGCRPGGTTNAHTQPGRVARVRHSRSSIVARSSRAHVHR
jgi:hypothetical protein